MKLSYLLKLSILGVALGLLPLSSFAACSCNSDSSTDSSSNADDVVTDSNAETQQAPKPEDESQ